MDRVDRDLIVNPSGLDSRVYGGPSLVNGVHSSAIQLDGRGQYVRVAGPYHKRECFGDLDHCPKGYYLGMWLHFDSQPTRKAVYMSNGAQAPDGHGIAMSYSPDGLEFVFKTTDGKKWTAVAGDVKPKLWQHVAASWDKDKGLYIYVNGHQMAHSPTPGRARQARSADLNDFVLGRSNDPSDSDERVGFKVDDFHFVSAFRDEAQMRNDADTHLQNKANRSPAYRYHLPMDEIRGDDLVMLGGTARVVGPVRTVPGKIRNAVSFSGRGEYVDLGQAGDKCLGNLDTCRNGFYISFFVKFNRLDNTRGYIYSTPHGIDIYHVGSQLMVKAESGRKQWMVSYNGLRQATWHFVEVSWSDSEGLTLYLDGEEVSHQARERSLREVPMTREMRVFLGRPNNGDRREMLSEAELDHVDIFYGTRDMLAAIDYIRAESPTHYHVDFEDIRGSQIQNEYLLISLVGSPRPEQVDGKVGRAIQLTGTGNQAIDFGDRTRECLGNLDLCHRGVMYAMWIKPDTLSNGATFLSTSGENGITLAYKNQRLHATAETSRQMWEVTTPDLQTGRWSYVEVSYHPLTGLALYVNNEMAAEDTQPSRRTSTPGRDADVSRFYLGRASQVTRDVRFADAAFDELEMWYADRDYLSAHKYIQRNQDISSFRSKSWWVGTELPTHCWISVWLTNRNLCQERLDTDRWYFVELTWHPDSGLKVYVDNELKGSTSKDFVAPASERSSFRIGRPNQGDVSNARYATGNFDIDELEIWYGKREDLMAFGFIDRGNRGYEEFKFDRADGRRVRHDRYLVQLMGGASLVGGRFQGAVAMNGAGQYVDLGKHSDKCLGNVDLCQHGITLSMYLRPRDLRMDQTFFAAPTHRLFYENQMLKAEVQGVDRTWTAETDRLRRGGWQRVTLAWHPKKGLSLYVDDELMDTDEAGVRSRRQEPQSESVYVGRAQGSTRVTARAVVDELQVWYEDLDQLRAIGRYKAQVVPYRISFTGFQNNQMNIRDRVILGRGDFRLVQGKGQNTRALRLFGTDGYIDLGQNFTCGGDLETCEQGATLRLGIRPENLRNGQVFFDSFPVSVWYEDGRLYARLQTPTQFWQVDTSNFRPGTWQRVELTWHPRDGLEMYIDGRRVDYQAYASQQSLSQVPSDWRTYFGRGLDGGRSYADTSVDNIELWTAYRDYLPDDHYLRIRPYVPPTPRPTTPRPVTPRPQTPRPYTTWRPP
ncbi:LOW QUALITY PROTEIN: neurexin-2-alpha, partial [Elysia marginata]